MVFCVGVMLVGLHPAAGALGAAEECHDTVLLATDGELSKSPRSDTSTEAVAAGLDQYAVATQACNFYSCVAWCFFRVLSLFFKPFSGGCPNLVATRPFNQNTLHGGLKIP